MKGVLFDDGTIEISDAVELRAPGPDEVRVRLTAAGVCHSDLSVVNGTIPYPTPVVLGHEGAGVVEEVGAAVTTVKPGDTVVLSTLGSCGRCIKCEQGRPTLCPQSFGRFEKPFTVAGRPAFQFANTSVFVEHTVVRETSAIPVDPKVPASSAALIGCAVLTGAGAVFNRAQVERGQTVAVFGVGGIGLNVIQAAHIAAAGRIIAVDNQPAKEAMAREFGATDFVDSSQTDAVTALKDLVPGGLDVTFEAVGHTGLLRTAIDVLAPGGTCVVLGVPPFGQEASFMVAGLYQDKAILGCRYGSSRPRADITMLADLYLAGRLKLDELVSRTYPLDDVEQVFSDMHGGGLARGVILF